MFWCFDTMYVLNQPPLDCLPLSNLQCSFSLGQVFYPSFLFVTFVDDVDVGRDAKVLVVLVVFEANMPLWFDKNQVGTDCPEEGKVYS